METSISAAPACGIAAVAYRTDIARTGDDLC